MSDQISGTTTSNFAKSLDLLHDLAAEGAKARDLSAQQKNALRTQIELLFSYMNEEKEKARQREAEADRTNIDWDSMTPEEQSEKWSDLYRLTVPNVVARLKTLKKTYEFAIEYVSEDKLDEAKTIYDEAVAEVKEEDKHFRERGRSRSTSGAGDEDGETNSITNT